MRGTGAPLRQFLFSDDAARLLLLLLVKRQIPETHTLLNMCPDLEDSGMAVGLNMPFDADRQHILVQKALKMSRNTGGRRRYLFRRQVRFKPLVLMVMVRLYFQRSQ